MNIFTWLKGRTSIQRRAMGLYRRGMVLAKSHKNQQAIDHYTAVIEMNNIPAGVCAMALFNRALVYHAKASYAEAIDDLNSVIEMGDAPESVKSEAQRKLVRMDRMSNRADTREAAVSPRCQGGTHARTQPKNAGKHTDSR